MNMRYVIAVILPSLVLFAGPNVWAAGWYLGGGVESVSFEDDLEGVDDGNGLVFSFGYRFTSLLAFDGLWGASIHDESAAGGEVAHGNLLLGLKLLFSEKQFQPYLTGGLSSHAADFDFFEEIDGRGFYWGLGADIYAADKHSIGIGYRSSSWDGEDSVFDYDVTTQILTIVYNYHFLR